MIDLETKKKAFEMAKEGKTTAEIENGLGISKLTINKLISQLNMPENEFYNPTLYNEIIFKRGCFKNLIDKDFFDDIWVMVNNGLTFIEIASLFEMKETEIKNKLGQLNNQSCLYYDPKLYLQIISQNSKNEVKNEKVLFQKFQALKNKGVDLKKISSSQIIVHFEHLFLAQNIIESYLDSNMTLSDQALATSYNVSISTIIAYLTGKDREQLILKLFGQNVLKMILQKREQNLIENRNKNRLFPFHSSGVKITEKEQLILGKLEQNAVFYLKLIFTFELSLDQFSKLINFPNLPTLHKKLSCLAENTFGYWDSGLEYLFTKKEEESHLEKATIYLELLKQNPDNISEQKMLRSKIEDIEYAKLLDKVIKGQFFLTDEDIRTIIKYKLKYGLPNIAIPFDGRNLKKRCPEDLKDELSNLSDYYNSLFLNAKSFHINGPKR